MVTTSDAAITKVCADCQQVFEISVDEQRWLAQLAARLRDENFVMPNRCTPCREARRRARYELITDIGQDEVLTCRGCSQPFLFTAGQKAWYVERNFRKPRRCPACRLHKTRERERRDAPRHA